MRVEQRVYEIDDVTIEVDIDVDLFGDHQPTFGMILRSIFTGN